MADYCKLIVSCTVMADVVDELNAQVEKLGLCRSAYQSQENVQSIKPNTMVSETGRKTLCVVLVGQTKFGRGQHEFCEWLRPYVVQGSGENDVFALSFTEHGDDPELWKK